MCATASTPATATAGRWSTATWRTTRRWSGSPGRAWPPPPPAGAGAGRGSERDVEEGADMIMVRPAMPYLDLIRMARDRFNLPLAAYQVSGEFSMIVAAARNGWLDRERAMLESLTAI